MRAILKAMATEEQNNVFDEGSAESQPADDAFSDQPASSADSPALATDGQLDAHDVFVGDEDFYKLLEESTEESPAKPAVTRHQPEKDAIPPKRFSSIQKVLAVSIVAVSQFLVPPLHQQ